MLKEEEDKQTEADVLSCLERLGHQVETLAVFNDVVSIVEKLKEFTPDVVFNLTESFHSNRANEPEHSGLAGTDAGALHGGEARWADPVQGQSARQEGAALSQAEGAALRHFAGIAPVEAAAAVLFSLLL